MQLDIRDKKYHLKVHQQREDLPVLVLLHGFMGTGDVFRHLLPFLAPIVNPVTVDLLGHGSTEGDTTPGRFNVEEQVEDIKGILESIPSDTIVLHGYSMGGRLALNYALTYPDSVKGLILESTAYGIDNPVERAERRVLDKQRAEAILADKRQFLAAWRRLSLFDNGIEVPADLEDNYQNIQNSQQPTYMASSLKGFGAGTMSSARQHLESLRMPVLIMAGESDEKYCTIAREMQSNISGSRAVIIKNAGHRVHLENPTAFVSEVKKFIGDAANL